MTRYYIHYTTFTGVRSRNKLKILNLNEMALKAKFSKIEITNVKRDFKVFGVNLLTIDGKPLNITRSNSDGVILNISPSIKTMDIFISVFNKGILSKHHDYLLNNNEFYLIKYRGDDFIVILDKINNLVINKRCFNKYGEFLTKVQDTLLSNGELNRDGEGYKAIYKETVITHLERKIKILNSSKSIHNTNKLQHQDIQQSKVTSQVEDSKVSISKSQSEEHNTKVKEDITYQKIFKNTILNPTPYKILHLIFLYVI